MVDDPDEVEADARGDVVDMELESGSASLKIFASGEFGARFSIAGNKSRQQLQVIHVIKGNIDHNPARPNKLCMHVTVLCEVWDSYLCILIREHSFSTSKVRVTTNLGSRKFWHRSYKPNAFEGPKWY